jgi:CDP-diacylglycerol--serine O-phosphatidyltransferase
VVVGTLGALRLARFNIQTGSGDRRYFVGLPIPAAACAVAACVYYHPEEIENDLLRPMSLVLVVTLALLMVSKARYRTFKELDLKARRPYVWILPVAITLALIATHPQVLLLVAVFAYVLSGLIPRWAPAARSETVTEGAQPAPTAGTDHGH